MLQNITCPLLGEISYRIRRFILMPWRRRQQMIPKHWYPCTKLHRITSQKRGSRWRRWLRHYATSRKVAGSIPDGFNGIFHWHNSSSCTMALGSTQLPTETSTRNISWGLRRPVRRADNSTAFICGLSMNLGDSASWNPQGLSRAVMGLLCSSHLRRLAVYKHVCLKIISFSFSVSNLQLWNWPTTVMDRFAIAVLGHWVK
jgi:hypothetical protein